MKEIKRKGRFKRVVKRIVKGMFIVIGVITALTIVFFLWDIRHLTLW